MVLPNSRPSGRTTVQSSRGRNGMSRFMPYPSLTLFGGLAIFLSSGVFQQAVSAALPHRQQSHITTDASPVHINAREAFIDVVKDDYISFSIQTAILIAFLLILVIIRFRDGKRLNKLSGEYVLHIQELNNAKILGQVFMSYLQAAILEPILRIVEIGAIVDPTLDYDYYSKLVLQILVLGSLCWWIWLLTDAFDYVDVVQQYKYRTFEDEVNSDPVKWHWLKIRSMEDVSNEVRSDLVGSLRKDVALWVCLIAIAAAWYPDDLIGVDQRDAVHAYAILFFWIVMHHRCRAASTWGVFYPVSFLLPSAALMPMQYCVPFIDCFDVIDDLASVQDLRDFVRRRTGVELIIHN